MIILSCALYSNWLPLLVGGSTFPPHPPHISVLLLSPTNDNCICTALTFVLAPLPNALFAHCGGDDFSPEYAEGSSPVDLGRFITAFIVVTGFSLPLVLAHSEIIRPGASVMSLIGGGYVRVAVRLLPRFLADNGRFYLTSAALYMGPSWHTQPPSDKTIPITSSPSAVPFSRRLACINQCSHIITPLRLL